MNGMGYLPKKIILRGIKSLCSYCCFERDMCESINFDCQDVSVNDTCYGLSRSLVFEEVSPSDDEEKEALVVKSKPQKQTITLEICEEETGEDVEVRVVLKPAISKEVLALASEKKFDDLSPGQMTALGIIAALSDMGIFTDFE